MSASRELEVFKYYCAKSGERVNYNKAKWAIRDLLITYEYSELIQFIDYYLRVATKPEWKKFAYNIEQIVQQYDKSIADKRRRQLQRNETLRLVLDER